MRQPPSSLDLFPSLSFLPSVSTLPLSCSYRAEWSSDSEDDEALPPPTTQQEAGTSTKSQRSRQVGSSKKIRGDPLRGTGKNANDDNGPTGGSNVLYLGHLPREFGERELERFLGQFGPVKHVRVSRSKKTGGSRGYAFVQFQTAEVASIVADTMAGYLLMGKRKLVCHVLTKEQVHPRLFYKRMPPNKNRAAPLRTMDRLKAVTDKLLAREQEKRDQLKELGIDYDFPGYAAATTILSDRPEPSLTPKAAAASTSSTPPNSAASSNKTRKRKESDASLEAAGLPLEPTEPSSSSSSRRRPTKDQSDRSASKKYATSKDEAHHTPTPVKATLPSTESDASVTKTHKPSSRHRNSTEGEEREARVVNDKGVVRTPTTSDSHPRAGMSNQSNPSASSSSTLENQVSSDSKRQKKATNKQHKDSIESSEVGAVDVGSSPSLRKDSVSSDHAHDASKQFSSDKKEQRGKKDKKERKDSVSSATEPTDDREPSINITTTPSSRKESVSSYDESKRSSEKMHKHDKKHKKQRKDSVSSQTETADASEPSVEIHSSPPSRRKDSVSSHDELKRSSEKKHKHDKKEKKQQRKDRLSSTTETAEHDDSKRSTEKKKSKHDKKEKKRKDRGNSIDQTGIMESADVDATPHDPALTSPLAQPSSHDRRSKSEKKKQKKEDKKKRRESAP